MALVLFFLQVVVISLSGALAPGPVTVAAIGMGSSNRFAGVLMALGHGLVEFPLMLLLLLGVGRLLKLPYVKMAIGLVGGGFLVFLAVQMFQGLGDSGLEQVQATGGNPLAAGILLSAGNPYFLVWWATVGLTLITTARNTFGLWVFGLMALAHWSCDLVWLTILSWASFEGSVLLGPTGQRIVLAVCAAVMLAFGLYFIVRQVIQFPGVARVLPQIPPKEG
jgi:threonine/homoserine/homoserine lactone efflux protein